MRAMPKIERTTSLTSTPKAQAVSRSTGTTPAEPAAPKAPVTEYAGQAAPRKELVPKGAQVSTSADPGALWGETAKPTSLDQASFQKLSPAEQHAAIVALREERNQLGAEIQARLAKLDIKWNNSRLVTRTEALRDYQEQTKNLDPATKHELDALLEKSEAAQRKINDVRARIDRLPKTPEAKKAQAALRSQLARELRSARSEQSKVVKAATAVVDEKGLKTDRLATTEQVIDPSAPAPGSGSSLLDKITRFLGIDSFFSWFNKTTFDLFVEPMKEESKRRDAKLEETAHENFEQRVKKERLVKESLEVTRTREALQAVAS